MYLKPFLVAIKHLLEDPKWAQSLFSSDVMWCHREEMFVRCCAVFVQQWCDVMVGKCLSGVVQSLFSSDVMWSWEMFVRCCAVFVQQWCDVIVGNVCQVLCSLCSAVIRCDVIVRKCLSGVVQSLFSSDVMWCDRGEMFVRCCAVFVQQWLDVMWWWGNVCQVLCSLCSAVIRCDVMVRKCLSGVVQSLFSSDVMWCDRGKCLSGVVQ